jgi:hypothetical protein
MSTIWSKLTGALAATNLSQRQFVRCGLRHTFGQRLHRQLQITNKADESPHAEVYLKWRGDKVCTDDNGDKCIWGDLTTGSVRTADKAAAH